MAEALKLAVKAMRNGLEGRGDAGGCKSGASEAAWAVRKRITVQGKVSRLSLQAPSRLLK